MLFSRVTLLMPGQQILQNLTETTDTMLQEQREIATGQALNAPSDNPGKVTQDLIVSAALSQVNNWQQVAQSALDVAQGTDQTLSEITSAADTAYTAGESALAPGNAADIQAVVEQLQAIQQSIGQLANTQVGDIYVLGGQSGAPPWSSTNPTVVTSSATPMTVQIGPNLSLPQNMAAGPLVTGILQGIQGVIAALQAPETGQTYGVQVNFQYPSGTYSTPVSYTSTNPPGTITATPPAGAPAGTPTAITATFQIGSTTVDTVTVPTSQFSGGQVSFTAPTWSQMVSGALANLQAAQNALIAAHAQFGTQMRQIQAAETTLSAQSTQLQSTQASLQSAPIPNVVADLATQEATYQAILQSASSMLMPTLANYLSQIGPA